jgi:DNA invertase Pin-like site-specific DNA recombinase
MRNQIKHALNSVTEIFSVTIDDFYWLNYVRQVNKLIPRPDQNPESPQEIRVVSYIRVSMEEQVEGYSLDEQERICREYADAQGWTMVAVYRDEGFTGTNDRRPGYRQMMRATATGDIHGVVTHKIDRAYRQLQGMMNTFSAWQQRGVFFASVTERIDFTTPWGKLILVVLAMIAEIFIDNLRAETIKGKVGRFKKGIHNGPPPFGYCRGHCSTCTDDNGPDYCYRVGLPDLHTEKHLVPHPLDSLAVQYAFEQYNTGDYTDKEIAELLNAFQVEGLDDVPVQVRSRGKMGRPPGPFTKAMVRDLLQNPFYTGVVPYYGSEKRNYTIIKYLKPQNINEGLHLPLISRGDFAQALQIRDVKNKMPRGTRGGRNPAHIYILQGLGECARCGAPMHCQMGGGRTPRLLCSTRIERLGVCDQKSVKSALLEAELATEFVCLRLPQNWQEDVIAYLLDEEGLSGLLARRQAIEEHFQHIRFLYDAEQINRQQYRREWFAFQRQSRDLDPARRTDLDLNRARLLLTDMGRLWSLLTPLEQKGLAQILLRVAIIDNQRVLEWKWYHSFQPVFQ